MRRFGGGREQPQKLKPKAPIEMRLPAGRQVRERRGHRWPPRRLGVIIFCVAVFPDKMMKEARSFAAL
jgi:hypothetical protein